MSDYMHFYQKFLIQSWDNLSPTQYGLLLATIAVVGWITMKSSSK